MRNLRRELGVDCLCSIHNIAVVECIADDVAVMQTGKIVEQGPTASVLGAPQQDYTRRWRRCRGCDRRVRWALSIGERRRRSWQIRQPCE